MDDFKVVLSFLQVIAPTVAVIWSWVKLDKKVALLDQKLDDKIDILNSLKVRIEEVDSKINQHLIDHT